MAYNFDINISVQKIQNEDFERLLDSLQNLQFFPFSVKIPKKLKKTPNFSASARIWMTTQAHCPAHCKSIS